MSVAGIQRSVMAGTTGTTSCACHFDAPRLQTLEEFTVATPSTKPASKRTTRTATKPATATPTQPADEIPTIARESREQLAASLEQSQQLCVAAAQTWVNALSVLPVMDLPKLPNLRDMQAATTFAFDVAADLLSAQREFTVQLTKVLLPAKTA